MDTEEARQMPIRTFELLRVTKSGNDDVRIVSIRMKARQFIKMAKTNLDRYSSVRRADEKDTTPCYYMLPSSRWGNACSRSALWPLLRMENTAKNIIKKHGS